MDEIEDLKRENELLKAKIINVEAELNKKEHEIYEHLETIENLEDSIIKLESLIPKEEDKKKGKKKDTLHSKLVLELEEKDKTIRNLKDRMGFLRKEKVQLQQDLEKKSSAASDSKVIRTESIRSKPPLEVLVKDLQEKVNNYKTLIKQLRNESIDVSEFDQKLKLKEEAIERKMAYSLQAQVDEQLNTIDSKNKELELLKIEAEKTKSNFEVLQVQLKIKDQKIEELKKQLKSKESKKHR